MPQSMNFHPKILFLFQNLPILTSLRILNDLDQNIRECIWQNKKARIKVKYFQYRKENGGFALPNFHLYYQTSSLTWLKNWITFNDSQLLRHEGHDLPSGWHAYLWTDG